MLTDNSLLQCIVNTQKSPNWVWLIQPHNLSLYGTKLFCARANAIQMQKQRALRAENCLMKNRTNFKCTDQASVALQTSVFLFISAHTSDNYYFSRSHTNLTLSLPSTKVAIFFDTSFSCTGICHKKFEVCVHLSFTCAKNVRLQF